MKKNYVKAEAYKVNFNANEQVAAACNMTADMVASKYPLGDGSASACTEGGGKYGIAGTNMCFVDGNGHFDGSAFGYGTFDFEVQYVG